MYISVSGKFHFSDLGEMLYNLFLEIGLSINANGYIFDQQTGIVLKYKEHFMKCTFNNEPIYAGKNDIVFDPVNNYQLMELLLGYYLEKEEANGNDHQFIAHFRDDEVKRTEANKGERFKQRIILRTKCGDICTQYYYNLYLAYSEAIFLLAGSDEYDLSNFDILPEV